MIENPMNRINSRNPINSMNFLDETGLVTVADLLMTSD
jgi:hypothetical protein